MKKLTFVFIMFFVVNTYAQEPTRQQTIDWLTSKIDGKEVQDPTCSDCEYNYFLDPTKFRGLLAIGYDLRSANTGNLIGMARLPINDIDSVIVRGASIYLTTHGNKVCDGVLNGIEQTSSIFVLVLNWNDEPNLENRMLKAFQNIAKENRAKKEAY